MALTLADEFVDERTAYYAQQDKSDRIEVKIRSRAIGYDQYPAEAHDQRHCRRCAGFAASASGLCSCLTWMEADLLRTPAAVERTLGMPVLGAIPASSGQKESAQATTQPGRVGAPKTA